MYKEPCEEERERKEGAREERGKGKREEGRQRGRKSIKGRGERKERGGRGGSRTVSWAEL